MGVSAVARSAKASTLLIAGFATLLWLLITQTVADADLWGHLRFGLDLLHTHHLPQWDTYSFTADRPWVNHEWLAELMMGIAYSAAGSLGLNLLKLASIAIVAAVVMAVARRERVPLADRVLLTLLVVLATYTRTQVIRPQLFSVPIFCVLLYALSQAERGRSRALVIVPVCFAVWVNVHGAWILGLACCGCWLALAAWSCPEKRVVLIATGIAAAAATLANPYGIGLWRFLSETVRPARPDVTDWKPLLQLPAGIILLDLLLPAMASTAVIAQRRRVPLRTLAVIGVLAWGTWRVGRVDAFLQAALGILFAPQILQWFGTVRGRLTSPVWDRRLPFGRPIIAAGAAAAVIAGALQLRTIEVFGAWLPDRDDVRIVATLCPGRKMLTWFDWGEYAIWHLAPSGIKVSLDGRRETVYSEPFLDAHSAFYRNEGSPAFADSIGAECAWIPARLETVRILEQRNWHVAARTPTSAVLLKGALPVGLLDPAEAPPDESARRVFPGP